MNNFNSWFLLLAILGFAQKYLNADSRFLRYAREAAYPFYLLHQTVIVIVGYYVVQWNAGAVPKFLVVCAVALVITVLLYDLIVRRVNVIRFLFGMKPKVRRIKAAQPAA
jgi:peptidoglycan/LPS O-acetylase OafA/YrhL